MSELDFHPTFLPSLTKTIFSGTILCGLFVAPAPVLAEGPGFKISINAGHSADDSNVTVTGEEWHLITDKELKEFKIDGGNLIAAAGKFFGKNPGNAFVRSPTPMEGNTVNLYEKFGGEQVTVKVRVKSASIVGVTSTPTIIATKDFSNNSKVAGTFNADISQHVSNTVESNWSSTGQLAVNQTVSYGIKLLGTGVGGETSLNYTEGWGKGGSTTLQTTVGSTDGLSVSLQPGQAVIGKLTASKGTLLIRVVYGASLEGLVWTNYNPTYKNHYFNGLPIAGIMSAAGLPNDIEYTDVIKVGFYSNSKVELVDGANSLGVQTIKVAPAAHHTF